MDKPVTEKGVRLAGRRYVSRMRLVLQNVFSLGMVYVLCANSERMRVAFTTRPAELCDADCVELSNDYGSRRLYAVQRVAVRATLALKRYTKAGAVSVLDTPYGRFLFDYHRGRFVLPPLPKISFSATRSFADLLRAKISLSPSDEERELAERRTLYGSNTQGVSAVPHHAIVLSMLTDYVFLWQAVTLCVYLYIGYRLYALMSALFYSYSFASDLARRIRHENSLRRLARSARRLRVLRAASFVSLDAADVLPGDIVYVESGPSWPCDALVVHGSVVVDESFITGENVPVHRPAGTHVLSGTNVLQSVAESPTRPAGPGEAAAAEQQDGEGGRAAHCAQPHFALRMQQRDAIGDGLEEVAVGFVVRTGHRTERGRLLRSLLFRKPVGSSFYRQSFRIQLCVLVIALVLVLFFEAYLSQSLSLLKSAEYSFDLALAVFNPAMHTSLELGASHAATALARKGVVVSEVPRIRTAGEVDVAIFDKTGTLTAGELDVVCIDVLGALRACDAPPPGQSGGRCTPLASIRDVVRLAATSFHARLLRAALATCHSLVSIGDRGKVVGDAVDAKLFEFACAELLPDGPRGRRVRLRAVSGAAARDGHSIAGDCASCGHPAPSGVSAHILSSRSKQTCDECNVAAGRDEGSGGEDAHGTSNEAESGDTSLFTIIETEQFDAALKRMSVVAEVPHVGRVLFVKGAPDALAPAFIDAPDGYKRAVDSHSLQGRRVIALGYCVLEEASGCFAAKSRGRPRLDCPDALRFLGLAVFADRLKSETESVITELREANIPARMCTGDSLLTAISVAREAAMIGTHQPVLVPVTDSRHPSTVEWVCVSDEPHTFDKLKMELCSEFDPHTPVDFVVACEGREFELLRSTASHASPAPSTLHDLIIRRGAVFARFSPAHKKALVEEYASRGHVTLYVGDGANDTGALAAADVGLSLAENEATLAAAFSSRSIAAATTVVREGRSALAMSVSTFKQSLYGQLLQSAMIGVLLIFFAFPSDMSSVILDLVTVYGLGYTLMLFRSARKISSSVFRVTLLRSFRRMLCEVLGIAIVSSISCVLLGSHIWASRETGHSNLLAPADADAKPTTIRTDTIHSSVLFLLVYSVMVLKTWMLADFGPHREPRSKNLCFIASIAAAALLGVAFAGLVFFGREDSRVAGLLQLVPLSSARQRVVAASAIAASLGLTALLG